jgi:hypothetical protein
MIAAELAVRRYIAAWQARDREARLALLEACFAIDGRTSMSGQTVEGRAALDEAIEAMYADPQGAMVHLTGAIDAAGPAFRFRASVVYADGSMGGEFMNMGEIDAEGRIVALYTFVEPLADVDGTSPG